MKLENNQDKSSLKVHGGARKNAGRKQGAATTKTREIAEKAMEQGITPLEVMLLAMREKVVKANGIDEYQDIDSGEIKSTCKPSIHMPRWASRITLEITDVRIEPVQEIIEDDALAEGCEVSNYPYNDSCGETKWATDHFEELWNSIYKNWDQNPWVWVIEFRRIEK